MTRIKNNSYLRLGLGLVLILGFFCTADTGLASAEPERLRWSVVNTPSNIDNLVVSPSEINAIVVGAGNIAYAVDVPGSKVYRSIDGGVTWRDGLASRLVSAGAALPVWDIAIALDNPDFVAAVTSDAGLPRRVFISIDGGANWNDTGFTIDTNIGAIDISPNDGSYDIAIGTRTGGSGDVYVKTSGYGSWVSQSFTGDVMAVKFSPTYTGDSTLVVVSSDATGTYVNLGVYDRAAEDTNWSTWGPVEVSAAGSGTSPTAGQIITADLDLPSDFSGQNANLRRIYASTHDAGASGNAGVYRIDDTAIHRLLSATATRWISSIAYYGTYNVGKFLVGEVTTDASLGAVNVLRGLSSGGSYPSWQSCVKSPTGGGNSGYANAQVVWSHDGSSAYCGTSSADLDTTGWPGGYQTGQALDESAFSITLDDGETWNQLSLVDTQISFLSDVVASADSKKLYLASINDSPAVTYSFDSVWRSTSDPAGRTWERVLCLPAASDDTILRLNTAGADENVFFAVRSSNDLFQSRNNGQSWRNMLPGVTVTDFAATEIDGALRIYVLDDNFIRKGESTGQTWKWDKKVDTDLYSGHTITAMPSGVVVVGDAADGMVAYSDDGGDQFMRILAVPVPGKMHVVVDSRVRSHIVIYAASDGAGGEIYGWVVGISSKWSRMSPPGQDFYGIVQASTLYAVWSNGGGAGVARSLNPEALEPPFIEWDSLTTGLSTGVTFTREPASLKISGGVDLWAIDDRSYTDTNGRLWVYCDCLTTGTPPTPPSPELLFKAPSLVSPAMDEVIAVDSTSGQIVSVNFKWRHPTPAREYEWWLAKDEGFSQLIMQQAVVPGNLLSPAWILLSGTAPIETGETYYWKARVTRAATGETGSGQWSEVMSFNVAPSLPQKAPRGPTLLGPAENATGVDRSPLFSWIPSPEATAYEFILAEDEALERIVTGVRVSSETYEYGAELDEGATYFWQVKAIEPFMSQPSSIFSFTVTDETETSSWIANLSFWVWILIALAVASAVILFIMMTTKSGIFRR